jgi:hypothetical protein
MIHAIRTSCGHREVTRESAVRIRTAKPDEIRAANRSEGTDMKPRIQITADRVQSMLRSEGPLRLGAFLLELGGVSAPRLAMAVGWLARDEVVTVTERHEGMKVGLKAAKPPIL